MLNFFRKIRRGSISKNKFSRYLLYAVGEIILVVVGILIAIQINTFNKDLENKSREQALLKELNKESKENLRQLEENKMSYIQSLEACDIVIRNIPNMGQAASVDSILRYGPGMFRGITFDPSNGLIESLLSTGEIQLIRNDTLRNYLITWKDNLKDFQEEEANSISLWKNQIEPYIIQNGNFLNPSSTKNIDLLKDPVFLNMIARRRFYVNSILWAMKQEPIERNLKEIVRLSGEVVHD